MFSRKKCQYIELSEDMLKVHYDFVHKRKESNCGHRFLNTSDLSHHQRAIQEGVKHPCGYCYINLIPGNIGVTPIGQITVIRRYSCV